jgi:HEAT repeat protein
MEDDVNIENEKQAIKILDNYENNSVIREEAARFLEENPTENATQRLIMALTDDDFGVRWAASTALTKLGDSALPALLQALIKDPSTRIVACGFDFIRSHSWIQLKVSLPT